jgi:hypothetical protein
MSKRQAQKPVAVVRPSRPTDAAPTAPIPLGRSLAIFAILMASLLVFWRLVLLKPALDFERGAIQACFRVLPLASSGSGELITLDPQNGDWVVHASLLHLPEREVTRQIAGAQDAGVRTQPVMLQCFSVCFPLFWAVTLAVWPGKEAWRILGIGTLALAIVSEVALILFVAYWTDRYFVVAASRGGEFFLQLVGYCALNVIPYATPLIMAVWLHRRLQAWVFAGFPSQKRPAPKS